MDTQKKLIETYQKAQKKLVEIIQQKQAHGSATAYEKSLLRQIQKELKKLKKSSKTLVEQLVRENYKTGLQSLIDDLLKDNTAPRLFNMFSRLNTSQIEIIVQNANIDLNKAINLVGRRVQDAIREAGIEATAEKLTTGQTVREMQRNLEKKLQQQNLIAVEYANGTKMPIEKYAETVSRSTTAETQNKAKIVQGQDWGYDLVRFTEHSPTCEVCSMYQGRVYALTKEAANGKYKGTKGQLLHFPYLYDTVLPNGYSTIHPNCRHRLAVLPVRAYTATEMEEFSRRSMQPFEDMRSDRERKAYAKEQEVKRKRNESRRQYERIKAVLPNDAPKTFAGFVRMKSANSERYRELLNDYRAILRVERDSFSDVPKIFDAESEKNLIKNNDFERGVVYNSNGEIVLYKEGNEHSLSFSDEEAKLLNGMILSHNHPSNSPPSPADIYNLRKFNLAEVRAVTKYGVYSVKQPEIWEKDFTTRTEFYSWFDNTVRKLIPKISKQLESGKITVEQADNYCWLFAMRRMERMYGFKINLIRW